MSFLKKIVFAGIASIVAAIGIAAVVKGRPDIGVLSFLGILCCAAIVSNDSQN